jgi:hypothetical protein
MRRLLLLVAFATAIGFRGRGGGAKFGHHPDVPDVERPAGSDGALRGSRNLWLQVRRVRDGEAPGQLWLVARVEDLRPAQGFAAAVMAPLQAEFEEDPDLKAAAGAHRDWILGAAEAAGVVGVGVWVGGTAD